MLVVMRGHASTPDGPEGSVVVTTSAESREADVLEYAAAVMAERARQLRAGKNNPNTKSDVATKLEPETQAEMFLTPGLPYTVADLEPLHQFFIHLVMSDIEENEYKTSDFVKLTGGFDDGEKSLKINGYPTIYLTPAEFLVLLILSAHSRSRRSLPSPWRTIDRTFLSAKDIVAAVEDWQEEEPRLEKFWTTISDVNVHRTVSKLRVKIRRSGADADIIDTGPERGYRLNTSSYHVLISLR